MKRREITIPTILGLLVAVGGLVSGLWLLSGPLRDRISASAEEEPKSIKITNIADTSFVVSWITDKAAAGFVQYGEAGQTPELVVSDERDQQKGSINPTLTHYVVVRGLRANTRYNFRIGSGRNVYDKQGQLYETTTGAALSSPPAADVAYGQVVDETGNPADGAIVYLTVPGMAEQAGLIKSSGSWVIPLSTARSADLQSYASYNPDTARMNLFIQSATSVTQAGFPLSSRSPVPQITLGQSQTSVTTTTTPVAATSSATSKFSADAFSPATEAGELVLLTPKFGENVNSARPEIIGNAPAGTEITIEIHSTAVVSGKVVTNSSGAFSFSVPQDLPPGEHTVTISAIIDGVVRRVTRSFTVYAQGESTLPYYSATPSATLAPFPTGTTGTITPTVTIKPSITPLVTPTGTATISGTPKPTLPPRVVLPPATDSALPVSGYDLPTFMLIAMGGLLLLAGGWWYRRLG